MKKSQIPIKKLKVNDKVVISGTIFTARDKAHQFLLSSNLMKKKMTNSIIYHCGPIIKNNKVIAAGPTSSTRLEKFMPDIIKKYKIKLIIGKGGMGEKTASACKRYGCVYVSAAGGAGVKLAQSIIKIDKVYKKEFGAPEAIWELVVKDFPGIVTIDTKGNSLHKKILKDSEKKFKKMLR